MRIRTFLLAVLVLAAALPAAAEPVEWELADVTFIDGGVVTGSFTYDPQTGAITACALSVSGGDEVDFPPTTYTHDDYDRCIPGWGDECSFFWEQGVNRQLRITFMAPLASGAGEVAVDLETVGNGSGSTECFNCNPWRKITGGRVVEAVVANEDLPWSAVKAMYE